MCVWLQINAKALYTTYKLMLFLYILCKAVSVNNKTTDCRINTLSPPLLRRQATKSQNCQNLKAIYCVVYGSFNDKLIINTYVIFLAIFW